MTYRALGLDMPSLPKVALPSIGAHPVIAVPAECAQVEALLSPSGLAELLHVPSLPEELRNRYVIWAWPSSRLPEAQGLSDDEMWRRAGAVYRAWKDAVGAYRHITAAIDAKGYGTDPATKTFYMVVKVVRPEPNIRAVLTQARSLWQSKLGAAFGTRMAVLTAEGVLPAGKRYEPKHGYHANSAAAQAAAAAIGGAIDNLRAALVRAAGPTTRSLLPGPMSGTGALTAALRAAEALPAMAQEAIALADEVVKRAPEALRVGVTPDQGLAIVTALRSAVREKAAAISGAVSQLDRGEEAARVTPSASSRLGAELRDPATPARLVESVRRQILSRTTGVERDFPDELRRRYVVCSMWRTAASVDIPGYMAALSRALAEAESTERAFASATSAIGTARAAAGSALERLAVAEGVLSKVESRLDFPWWRRRLGPLPVWAWGLIAGGVAVGGAAVVRATRSA